MDREQLRQKASEMRASLFGEGVLNNFFLNLEYIEEGQPNFVEHMIVTFFSDTEGFLNDLRQTLEIYPPDIGSARRLMLDLKSESAAIGAARFYAAVSQMCEVFKTCDIYSLYDEFQRVTAEHAVLKSQLQPYAKILRMLREAGPPAPPPGEGSASSNGDI